MYYESFTSSILGNFQAVPLMRDCLFDCQLFSYYGNFTSSILGNFQAVPLMRDIVYLTASYFLLWKFYLVTLGNFFQAAPLTRDCLILLPLVATLILSSIMGPFMFLFLGCVTCLLILLLPPLILGLAQSASLRLLGSDKLKV